MGLRTAVQDNRMRLLPFGFLLVVGWLFVSLGVVWTRMNAFDGLHDQFIGQTPASGFVGLAVILLTLLFAIYLYAEMGETTPVPEQFPPK